MPRRVLVTGGAGFVGASLAIGLKQGHPDWHVTAVDNLKRRGSELGLPRLREHGVMFVHGDVRSRGDLDAVGATDLILECSAEPSVLAGLTSAPDYLLESNLGGTINCLEHARRTGAAMIFLSTSRVYPLAALRTLPYRETETRFELQVPVPPPLGVSEHGIAERFTLEGPRSLYGTTKLCSELLVQEYADAYHLPAIINRCGVITGPWQMGRVDQGVVTHWVLSHLLGEPLSYIGYGGTGKQVRDVLHVEDLTALVLRQLDRLESFSGSIFAVGGGRTCSVSLCELTELCAAVTGRRVPIEGVAETRVADVPIFLSDSRRAQATFDWAPRHSPRAIIEDIVRWAEPRLEVLAVALGRSLHPAAPLPG